MHIIVTLADDSGEVLSELTNSLSEVKSVKPARIPANAELTSGCSTLDIMNVFEKYKILTRSQCRRLIQPKRFDEGLVFFDAGFKALVNNDAIKVVGQTQREPVYGLGPRA